mgnify:CR=1 FL=1
MDGRSITSHYGYHMTSWHVLLALSKQQADLSAAGNKTLVFDPVLPCNAGTPQGYQMPFLLPNVVGTVACTFKNGKSTFEVAVTGLFPCFVFFILFYLFIYLFIVGVDGSRCAFLSLLDFFF